jgi:hypothetical protein
VETREPEVKEEREWTVEAGNADRVEAPDAGRASDVPRRALNTASSGDGTSKGEWAEWVEWHVRCLDCRGLMFVGGGLYVSCRII